MRKAIQVIGFVLLVLAVPGPAQAVSVADKIILSLNPGLGFFAMRDINQLIANNQSGFMTAAPTPGLSRMTWGLDLSSSLFYGLTDFLLLGAEYAYLVTDTSAKVGEISGFPPQDEYYKISLPAAELGAAAKVVWPVSDQILLAVGFGVSWLSLMEAGERIESRDRSTGTVYSTADLPYTGSALGFKVSLGADYLVWEWISLGLEAGYRLARFEEVQSRINGNTVTLRNQDGSRFTLDYSGLFVRYTFRFYF